MFDLRPIVYLESNNTKNPKNLISVVFPSTFTPNFKNWSTVLQSFTLLLPAENQKRKTYRMQ
jgi:hypothetical protein